MKLKPFVKEILLLIFVAVAAGMVTFVFMIKPSADGAAHHVYKLSKWGALTPSIVLLAIIIIYLIKEAFYRYRRKFQNMVLITSIFLEILTLLYGIVLMARRLAITTSGITIYPYDPQMSITLASPPPSMLFTDVFQIFIYSEIILLILLVIIAIVTGKNWNISQRENQIL